MKTLKLKIEEANQEINNLIIEVYGSPVGSEESAILLQKMNVQIGIKEGLCRALKILEEA